MMKGKPVAIYDQVLAKTRSFDDLKLRLGVLSSLYVNCSDVNEFCELQLPVPGS
jgi:hypothetical protein